MLEFYAFNAFLNELKSRRFDTPAIRALSLYPYAQFGHSTDTHTKKKPSLSGGHHISLVCKELW